MERVSLGAWVHAGCLQKGIKNWIEYCIAEVTLNAFLWKYDESAQVFSQVMGWVSSFYSLKVCWIQMLEVLA